MNIVRWTWRVATSLFGGILAQTDSPGTPAGKNQLADTRFALNRIARLTTNNPAIDQTYCKAINEIASNAYKAAKQ